jgi:hypothetical protein
MAWHTSCWIVSDDELGGNHFCRKLCPRDLRTETIVPLRSYFDQSSSVGMPFFDRRHALDINMKDVVG